MTIVPEAKEEKRLEKKQRREKRVRDDFQKREESIQDIKE